MLFGHGNKDKINLYNSISWIVLAISLLNVFNYQTAVFLVLEGCFGTVSVTELLNDTKEVRIFGNVVR